MSETASIGQHPATVNQAIVRVNKTVLSLYPDTNDMSAVISLA
ncbi:MAG: hypothetical protein RLZZ237_2850 [Pseudomonadota bacterium]|jgi:hypothetical protein